MRVAVQRVFLAGLIAASVAAVPATSLAAHRAHRAAKAAVQDPASRDLNLAVLKKNAEIEARNQALMAAADAEQAKAQAEYAQKLAASEAAEADYKAKLAEHNSQMVAYQWRHWQWEVRQAACKAHNYKRCNSATPLLSAQR